MSEDGARQRPAAVFTPVATGRISVEIVDQIKLAIRDGRLHAGDRLPPERDLTARFGVSRVTVRDALRILEAAGLIEIRVGARGGAYVRAPGSDRVGEGIANMLMMRSVSAQEVTEARLVLELGIVPLVCSRSTEEDLAALDAIVAESRTAVSEGTYHMDLSATFHVALARASHNAAVEMLVESLRGPLLLSLMRAREVAPAMGIRGVREHAALVKAIRARDADRAHAIMSRHLGRTARLLRKRPAP